MRRIKASVILLVVLACAVRALVIFNFDNKPGDSVAHVENAISILENHRSLHFDANVSVLYRYFLAAILYLWNNPLFSPRIFTALFGAFLIVPFYFLIKMLFNERIAFYANLVLVFYPLHALQSGNTTSDVVFYFFFFSSLYYFFKFKHVKKRLSILILSAILFNIAALLRFESWLFIPLLSFLLFRDSKKYATIFFFSSIVCPCLWLYLCYSITKDPFYSFVTAYKAAHAEILVRIPHNKQILGWLNVLYKNIGYNIVLCGLCGMVFAFFKKRSLHLALFFLLLFLLYTLNSLLSRMWYNERYSIILGLLILPYSVLFIEALTSFFKIKPVILFLPFTLLCLLEFNKIIRSPNFYMPSIGISLPQEVKDIAAWLKKNVSSTENIILSSDRYDMYIPDIVIRSGISPRRTLEVYTQISGVNTMTKGRIMEYIFNDKPRYLVLFYDSYLQQIINFDSKQKEINKPGLIFKLVYKTYIINCGSAYIYEIIYNSA
ncbi:MAG: glycosyltransferase family 39 protein [Candidatus Omnitrophica bacterium]|nr:glycosyltransferase family 39 protein [Candidatus Omnitrophota bacterium]